MNLSSGNRPLAVASVLMICIFGFGVTGYKLLDPESSIVDAMYMTVITLTTVGFEEVIDLSDNPAGRIFTMVLLFLGVGTFVYFFSALTGFIVEGSLENLFWRRRMKKEIDHLRDHYIVCGGGHMGEHIVRELLATSRPFVLIESNEERVRALLHHFGHFDAIVGDATQDETLLEAGIERAAGLFASISSDKDNLIIVISARLLQPKLRIVSRSTDDSVEKKIRRAGADVVVSANVIGGLRMTSEMVRPTVVSFLDEMLRDREKRLRVEESTVAAASELEGITAGELRRRAADMLLVAIRSADGNWNYNPSDSVELHPRETLIYIGSPEARARIERLATAS